MGCKRKTVFGGGVTTDCTAGSKLRRPRKHTRALTSWASGSLRKNNGGVSLHELFDKKDLFRRILVKRGKLVFGRLTV